MGKRKLNEIDEHSRLEKFERIKEDIQGYYNHEWNKFFRDFGACATGALIPYFPVYAFYDTLVPKLVEKLPEWTHVFEKMTGDESDLFRLTWAPVVVIGAYVLDKLRTWSRNNSKSKSIGKHDSRFTGKLNSLLNFVPYTIKYGFDLAKTIPLTIGTYPFVNFIGRVDGFITDSMKDFLDFEKTDRLPKWIENSSQKTKYGLASLAILGSLGIKEGIYKCSDYLDSQNKEIKQSNLEKEVLPEYRAFSKSEVDSFFMPDGSSVRKNYKSLEDIN